MTKLLCAADVARLAQLTPAAVRSAARSGRLKVESVTVGGVRLFSEAEVRRFMRERPSRPPADSGSGEAA